MKIQQTTGSCKPLNSTSAIFFANSISIPHVWYHKVLRGGNKPDNVGITILSELLQLHLASETGEREFQIGYTYIKTKFNYTTDQIYEALVRLEKSSFIRRDRRSQQNANDLFITLNVENLLTLHYDTNNDNDIEQKQDLEEESLSPANPNTSAIIGNFPNIDLYIDNLKRDIEVKRKNYISGPSFNQNSPDQNQNPGKPLKPESKGLIFTAKKWVRGLTRKPLASFLPLTEEDATALRLSSGREFNLHFINQLILRLSAKLPEHGFYKKELFMKYMTEILANEMRQAVNVNNEGFRFKRTDEGGVAEEYLAKVEDEYDTKTSNQLRKKVAASFEPTVAYKILTSCYFPEAPQEGKYEIKQRSPLELSKHQRERLYSQVSSVFGDRVENIEIIKNFRTVAKPQHVSTFKESQGSTCALDTATIWGRVRRSLISLYGEAIDKSWFSRLEFTDDTASRSLVLTGASFLTYYIQTNYSHMIERLCREENYRLKFG